MTPEVERIPEALVTAVAEPGCIMRHSRRRAAAPEPLTHHIGTCPVLVGEGVKRRRLVCRPLPLALDPSTRERLTQSTPYFCLIASNS
jgi:hypothetical protein